MKIAFTGPRDGMREKQKEELFFILSRINTVTPITESHDGDCVGSDKTFHMLMMESFPTAERHIHPCNIEKYRAHCERFDKDAIVHKIEPPLKRNNDIVIQGKDRLFATPKDFNQLHSGTWYTINCAISKNRPVIILV